MTNPEKMYNSMEVTVLLGLFDRAFARSEWHSLLSNLGTTASADWEFLPDDGHRSIRDIVRHVGGCKLMYENHAFGDRRLQWDDPRVDGAQATPDLATAVTWLTECQHRLVTSVASLNDEDLDQPRYTNWGELRPTRWIITTLIEHDLYHAGEINHLRALSADNDRWEYE